MSDTACRRRNLYRAFTERGVASDRMETRFDWIVRGLSLFTGAEKGEARKGNADHPASSGACNFVPLTITPPRSPMVVLP
jgi:hypothetical protein